MKKLYLMFAILSIFLFSSNTFAQPASITWPLDNTNQLFPSNLGNVTGSAESISPGSGQFGMSVFDYNINGQRLWEGTAGWIAGAEELSRYIQFNALPASGYSFTVTNVSFNYGDNQTGYNFNILNSNVYYSTDNWNNRTLLTAGLAYLNTTMSTFTQNVNVQVAAGSTFSLRIYPFAVQNSNAGTPTFAIHNNVVINGTTTLALGSLCGMKFNDLNGNGVKDAGETGLPGWLINLSYSNAAGHVTLVDTTDANGNYCFNSLQGGGTYTVSETNQSGWQQTTPSTPGTYTVTLADGQNIDSLNFGNKLNPAESCITWDLLNSTSVTSVVGNITGLPESMGVGSPTLSTGFPANLMSIYGYSSNGQELWVGNTGGTWVPDPPLTPTFDPLRYIQFNASPNSGNTFTVTNVSFNYGDDPNIANFNILNFQAYYSTNGWLTKILLNSTPLVYLNLTMSTLNVSGLNVPVASGQTFSLRIYMYPVLHGIAMAPTFAIHNNVVICGTTAPEIIKTGSMCGMKFNDLNGNGVRDTGEAGLPGWIINLSYNNAAGHVTLTDTTDANGNYCFNNLQGGGTYTVSETNQSGWQQTAPPTPGTYTVTLTGGQNIDSLNFGNKLVPTLGCVEPPPGMVAWWPFDETSGSTSIDLAGFNNSGTHINGPVPVPAKVSGGLQFDGINDYVAVPDHSELNFGTGDFSIDAWIKTSDSTNLKIIVDKQTLNGYIYQGYSFYLNYGYLTVQLADGVPPTYFTNWSPFVFVADGNWHHVAVTVSRSNNNGIVFYKDGVATQFGDPTVRSGSLTTTSPLTIGRQSYTDQFEFNGILDEIELFNRALSSQEIVSIFAADSAGKCKPSKPTNVKKAEDVPQRFKLMQSYPNPFNPTTQIAYEIPFGEFVSLRVFNSLGQQVAVLVNEQRPAGAYTVTFHASDLPSGIYFYRLIAGNFQQTRKMLLLK
ncbi:MAG: T9SS type A sorting domain-containing protein [Ignavibacteriales bacterium]|nr:T9SS type A sorting domain-containing protein [Ignavibacteriales bacterium]